MLCFLARHFLLSIKVFSRTPAFTRVIARPDTSVNRPFAAGVT